MFGFCTALDFFVVALIVFLNSLHLLKIKAFGSCFGISCPKSINFNLWGKTYFFLKLFSNGLYFCSVIISLGYEIYCQSSKEKKKTPAENFV